MGKMNGGRMASAGRVKRLTKKVECSAPNKQSNGRAKKRVAYNNRPSENDAKYLLKKLEMQDFEKERRQARHIRKVHENLLTKNATDSNTKKPNRNKETHRSEY